MTRAHEHRQLGNGALGPRRSAAKGRLDPAARLRAGVVLARACAVLGLVAAAGAQIVTADAGVASPELPSVRTLASAVFAEHHDELRLLTEATYSPRTDLELRLTVPAIQRELELRDGEDDVTGLGDVALRAKYALLREDDVMRSSRMALLVEAVFPTGDHDRALDGVLLPRRLQPGLGSWGAGLGIAGTIVRDRHRASLEAGYRAWTRSDGYEPGAEVRANAAWWYRLSPARFDVRREEAEYRLVLELLASHRADDRAGEDLENGGSLVWGLLGLQVNLSPASRFEIGAMLPLHQDADDDFGERELAALVSFKIYF